MSLENKQLIKQQSLHKKRAKAQITLLWDSYVYPQNFPYQFTHKTFKFYRKEGR